MNLINKLCLFIAATTLLTGHAVAKHTIVVTDQNQKPVADAIVSFMSTEANSPASEAVTGIAIMDQIEQQFSPKVLIVEQNQQVIFPNSDNTRHHVYSFSPTKPFEIKLYSGTPNTPITFEKEGLVTLGCNIHDDMIAYIYVKKKEITALTDTNGIAILDKPPSQVVSVWHFDLNQTNKKNTYQAIKGDDDNWHVEIDLIKRAPKKSNTFKARYK